MTDPIEAAIFKWFDGYPEYQGILEAFKQEGVPTSFRRQMRAAIDAYHEAGGTVAVSRGPTQEVVDAIQSVLIEGGLADVTESECAYIYQVAIAAAEKG